MMISDLPHDLESEILSRVPAKSLAKLQTVCKRWNALFRDPNFVRKNFGKSAREVIFLKNSSIYTINVNFLDQSIEFRGKLSTLRDSKDDVRMYTMFHCEGLLLCYTSIGNRLMVVCNPCTGEAKMIKPKTYHRNRNSTSISVLGYDKICHNYKILWFIKYRNIDTNQEVIAEFEIYDFSSDSWRVLDGVIYNWYFHTSNGVSLKGNTYWLASDKASYQFILSFDFTRERFRRVSLPFQSDGYRDSVWAVLLSVVREQQLSVLIQKYRGEIQIWVTNNIDDANEVVWSVFLVVDCGRFMIHDDVMIKRVESFMLDEDNKKAVCVSGCYYQFDEPWTPWFRIHIVGEDIIQQVYEFKEELGDEPIFLNYVPSLVQIQKNTPKGKKVKHMKPSLVSIEKNAPQGKKVKRYREVSLISSFFSFWSSSFWARLVLFLLIAFAFEIGSVESARLNHMRDHVRLK